MTRFVPWLKKHAKGVAKNRERDLRHDYDNFVKLLAENDFALELINELHAHFDGESVFTIPYLRNTTKSLLLSVQNAVRLLNLLTDEEYPELVEICESLAEKIRGVVTGASEPIYTPTAVFIDYIYHEMADKVGDKMANLGEIKNRLQLPVPDGFGTTVCAYTQFIEYSHLDFAISRLLEKVDLENTESLLQVEQDIKELIRKAALPYDLSSSLQKGCQRLARGDSRCFASFRSSALGEDTDSSFAGQYSSLLNIPPAQAEEAYKEVVASKYNARAIYYQQKRGYRDQDIAMSVAIMKMVRAVASGVIYTEDPNDPDSHLVTISGLWGLGRLLVDGEITPDTFVFDKESGNSLLAMNISTKRVMLVADPRGGLKKVRVPDRKRDLPCLNEFQLQTLLSYAQKIEEHYQWPQDIEWALDEDGTLYILQSRPLTIAKKAAAQQTNYAHGELLLQGGETACGGIGAGVVFRYRTEHDLARCPKGAVLVSARTSPRFVKVMDRVSAIVTNVGSLTDHMSSLAREFHVPTLVNTRKATRRLSEQDWVIVDASQKLVYRGSHEQATNWDVVQKKPVANIKATESYRVLSKVIPFITPLNLCDPDSPQFTARNCRSLHDIIRFVHETGMKAMYDLASKTTASKSKQRAYRLKGRLPLLTYVIDVDGRIINSSNEQTIKPEDVDSRLFQAFWTGLSCERLHWEGFLQGKLDLQGFFSAMSQTMVTTLVSDQTMGSNYFIVAANYLNVSLRFGYHFTTIDAYVCSISRDNYVVLTFKGGAAPEERRLRRIKVIGDILLHLEFDYKAKGDFIKARWKYGESEECLQKLDLLGRLVACTRLLDMALTSDALVEQCVQRFLQGDYTLGIFADRV
ncbi:MAG: hypothetical protein JRI89_07405 [Deltaproteobacteria bacterium]|nr:hypothetical protein [Deltaproteobacteria bacterium]